MRCRGTKSRYALRCTLEARNGFLTCKRHERQEAVCQEIYKWDIALVMLVVLPRLMGLA